MGVFIQPKVAPLPTGTNLEDKTIIVTGTSAGIGFETARQLLTLNASTIILAVVNKECSSPNVKVMKLEMDDYTSVKPFAKAVSGEVPFVNYLLLNAGIGILKRERSVSGHERTMQINCLSNVLLILELIPYLEARATTKNRRSFAHYLGRQSHALEINRVRERKGT